MGSQAGSGAWTQGKSESSGVRWEEFSTFSPIEDAQGWFPCVLLLGSEAFAKSTQRNIVRCAESEIYCGVHGRTRFSAGAERCGLLWENERFSG